jgi:hypothetical protein
LNKAVSNNIGSIEFFSEGADGGRVHKMDDPKNTSSVDTVLLDDLIDGQVDFLKMDIEGSETDVLCASRKLNKVKQLFIEYHSFVDETQNLGDLLSCLAKNNFRYYIHTQFCSKKPLVDDQIQLGMDLQLNIFAKQLQDMKPTERPIHCSDKKRMQFYIKEEDKWEKDTKHSKIDKSIGEVMLKQIKKIRHWEDDNPNFMHDEKLRNTWNKMIQQTLGGASDDEMKKNKMDIKKEVSKIIEVKNAMKD